MQKIFFWLIALVLVGVGGFYAYKNNVFGNYAGGDENQVFCTMEAKQCPDGSYVGRGGPKCEFAACPTATSASTTTTQGTQINKKVTAYNFSVTPTEVVEDSRCPTDVQCIHAGTVRVKATLAGELGEYTATLELNKPLVNEEVSITLIGVSPAPLSTHQIGVAEYRFTFEIKKRN